MMFVSSVNIIFVMYINTILCGEVGTRKVEQNFIKIETCHHTMRGKSHNCVFDMSLCSKFYIDKYNMTV